MYVQEQSLPVTAHKIEKKNQFESNILTLCDWYMSLKFFRQLLFPICPYLSSFNMIDLVSTRYSICKVKIPCFYSIHHHLSKHPISFQSASLFKVHGYCIYRFQVNVHIIICLACSLWLWIIYPEWVINFCGFKVHGPVLWPQYYFLLNTGCGITFQ